MDNYNLIAEELIHKNPKSLLVKIKYIVFGSYFYFFGVIALSISISFGLTVLSIYMERIIHAVVIAIFGFAYIAFAITRSLFFRVPFKESYEISRNDYPELAKLISDLEDKLSAKIDAIYINDSMNAGVIQIPRLGVFGWYKNVLVLGLQILLYLDKEEFRSVLAHEMGHISNSDSKNMYFVHKIRIFWTYMAEKYLHTGKITFVPIIAYLNKVWPRLDAYTFTYSRYCESKADEFAIDYTNKKVWTNAMLKVSISGYHLNAFWTKVANTALENEIPSKNIFSELSTFIQKKPARGLILDWVHQSSFEKTRNRDSHPALEDRLKIQGITINDEVSDNLFEDFKNDAAKIYLEDRYSTCLQYFNDQKYNQLVALWPDFRERYKILDKQRLMEDTDVDSIVTKIGAVVQIEGILAAEHLINEFFLKHHDNDYANFYKGSLLLEMNNRQGEKILLDLAHNKKIRYANLYQVLYTYYAKHNMRQEAEILEILVQKEASSDEVRNIEIQKLEKNMKLVKYTLPENLIEKLKKFGNEHAAYIHKIYVVKRILVSDEFFETHIVAFHPRLLTTDRRIKKILKELLDLLENTHCLIISLKGDNLMHASLITSIPESLVYSRKG